MGTHRAGLRALLDDVMLYLRSWESQLLKYSIREVLFALRCRADRQNVIQETKGAVEDGERWPSEEKGESPKSEDMTELVDACTFGAHDEVRKTEQAQSMGRFDSEDPFSPPREPY